jgi:predicted cobalt transporter CbtA
MMAMTHAASVAVTLILFALLISAGIGGVIGRTKGRAREGALWGLLGFIGWIVIACLPPKYECPKCGMKTDPRYPWMHGCYPSTGVSLEAELLAKAKRNRAS